MNAMNAKTRRNVLLGLGFLAPNIAGFLLFTMIPLGFSLVMAFSNWDLTLHSMFKQEPKRFVGLDNFVQLVTHREFWRFLGNTLYYMMIIPFSVAGSLILALLLSRDLRGGRRRGFGYLLGGAVMVSCCAMLAILGAGMSAMSVVLVGLACGILVFGVMGATTFYRTLFFLPHFCSGVATFILWKKLYNPRVGPVNQALSRPLDLLAGAVNATPPVLIHASLWLCLAFMALLMLFGLQRLWAMYRDGELGWSAAIAPHVFLVVPWLAAWRWSRLAAIDPNGSSHVCGTFGVVAVLVAAAALIRQFARFSRGQDYPCAASNGAGSALMLSLTVMVGQLLLLGLGAVLFRLPDMAADGLRPPEWIADYYWAKPALMLMSLWGAIGSNNMLLYIAGLSNVPQELYEAADIDGASPFQRFWNVTWPQLAPTTFFIGIMSTIGGLRGGFEIARTMTQGGPAGSTTFLTYFIFTEGFETGRLGYASAVAWVLFAMTFALTLFNWKFGNKYVND